jgi:hypothetical protein
MPLGCGGGACGLWLVLLPGFPSIFFFFFFFWL